MMRTTTLPTVVCAALLACAPAVQAQEPRAVGPAGTVTISRPDYDRLLDLAGRQPSVPDVPPLAAALTRADIRARVDAGVVRATMQIEGEVFRTGTVKVPLVSRATLLEARMADRPLPLVSENDTHFAVLSGPSAFALTLDWGTPLTTTPGRGSFTMPSPKAGSATATIDVPGEQTDVHLNPGLIVRRTTSAEGRTIVEATLDPGSTTQVWWSTRESAPNVPARESRTLASVKTLVTIGEAELRLVALVDVTVVQGEPAEFAMRLPAGYEVTGATGASLDRTEERPERLVLVVRTPSQRRHQFLLSLERSNGGGSMKLATAFPSLESAQRETGEVAVEGIGTLEVSATDTPGLRRMDVREVDPVLASAARQSLLAAYRYQRGAGVEPVLTLDVTRFADAPVLAAVADRAVATTLVTSEGRALTEVALWVRNRAQSFIKVSLPSGASMISAEVAGEPVKPVEGKDGIRVPLLRPGFRSDGPYAVSFVYLHTGTPFDKKGDRQMTLPKMDLPVNIVEWELFVPDRYRADRFDGNAIAADVAAETNRTAGYVTGGGVGVGSAAGTGPGVPTEGPMMASSGQIVGRVVDSSGSAIPGATIIASGSGRTQSAVTDGAGVFTLSNMPSGPIALTAQLAGFPSSHRSFVFDQRPRQADFTLQPGTVTETVTVEGDVPFINTRSAEVAVTIRADEPRVRTGNTRAQQEVESQTPSVNVQNLQRRAAGVLPVRVEVPRAGTSHRFVKPLVIDEETVVHFRYKRR